MSLKMIRVALESHGYEVILADNARTGIEKVTVWRPDLIIQDLLLPDMDGLDLVRKLRERLGNWPVPILCVSGLLSRLDEARAIKGGFADIIVKPIDPLHLLEVVRFHLTVPLRPTSFEGVGRRVLVVDDDPLQLKLTQLWLANSGFEVLTAADGAAALATARRELPQAILSDVLMPAMDGFELSLAVRADPVLANTPIVLASSAYDEEDDRVLASRVGANALLPRGVGLEEITRALVAAIEGPPPPTPDEPADRLRMEHAHRTFWQLERQIRQNASLAQRCTLQATQLSVLAGVAEALAQNRAIEDVLGDVLAACLDMAGISKGILYIADNDGSLALEHHIGFTDEEVLRLRTMLGHESLFMDVARSGKVSVVPSESFPPEITRMLLDETRVTSLLVVPVVWSGDVYGVMLLGARDADVTGPDALAFARVLGSQMGQAINLSTAFRRLSVSEERFRSLVHAMEDTVFVLDTNGKVSGLYGRGSLRRGLNPQDFLGKKIEEMYPEYNPAHAETNARALRGESASYEWSTDTPSGLQYFQSMVSPIRDSAGRIAGAVRVTRDVTEQKRLQAQLMVSDRMVSIGTLAAGVAHEINNPLTAVIGNLDLVIESFAEPAPTNPNAASDEIRGALHDAREAAGRVRQIARDLKVLSRAEEDTRTPVDIHRVIDSSLRMAWNEIRHRAQFVKDFRTVPPVQANESRLSQVFLNLFINAAQAIPVGQADVNEIRVVTRTDDNGRVIVEVHDTGPGIPPEIQDRIFAPFFTTKPVGVGTGLGLAICQRIIASLGGEIDVESTAGQGTIFRISLPGGRIESEQLQPEHPRPKPTGHGRVLVVDDDMLIGTTVRRILAADHDVTVLADAQQALDRISHGERFDVILCDLMMPVVTGMEFYHALLDVAPDQATRIVFLTGGAFTASARAFLDEVANPWIEKPFEVDDLRNFISDRLGG
jgi:PAS domain S-box-containing protein